MKHGKRGTREYFAWANMVARCCNPNHPSYRNYGGRGIQVCAGWRSFIQFVADMGPAPAGMTLERIDNGKGYEPGNCRWASTRDQTRNKRNNIIVNIDGARMTLTDAANRFGLKANTVICRKQRQRLPVEEWFKPLRRQLRDGTNADAIAVVKP